MRTPNRRLEVGTQLRSPVQSFTSVPESPDWRLGDCEFSDTQMFIDVDQNGTARSTLGSSNGREGMTWRV